MRNLKALLPTDNSHSCQILFLAKLINAYRNEYMRACIRLRCITLNTIVITSHYPKTSLNSESWYLNVKANLPIKLAMGDIS
jgi:hypothetical protein